MFCDIKFNKNLKKIIIAQPHEYIKFNNWLYLTSTSTFYAGRFQRSISIANNAIKLLKTIVYYIVIIKNFCFPPSKELECMSLLQ